MMNRKECFLSSYEWKTIPWQNLKKSPKDTLFDMLVDMPGLLEELDALREGEIHHDSCQAFLRRLLEYNASLQRWYQHTSLTTPWLCSNTLLSHNEIGVAGAHLMALYWAARLAVFNILQLPIFSTYVAEDHALGKDFHAHIVSLMGRLMENQSGWFGRQAAVFPSCVVHCFVESIGNSFEKELERQKLLNHFANMQSTAISPSFYECGRV